MHDSEQAKSFFESLGRAVGQFSIVEHQLFGIFNRLISAHDGQTASAAFYSVINLNSRIDMVHAVAQQRLDDSELLSEWKNLRSRLKSLARTRNSIVHWSVVVHAPTGEWLLTPSFLDANKDHQFGQPEFQLDWERLNEAQNDFHDLAMDMEAFKDRLPPLRNSKQSPSSRNT